MKLNTLVLGSAAAGLAIIGAAYLVAPNFLPSIYGFSLQSVSETNLFRSAYGGVFLAFTLLLCAGAFKEQLAKPALFALLTLMGGFAFGRTVSMVFDGMPHVLLVVIFVVEVTYTLAAIYLLQKDSTPS